MDKRTEREKLRDHIIHQMMDIGEWEALDTYGNGQITLSDEQSMAFAEWAMDQISDTFDTAHVTGWYDGLYSDPENGRPHRNPYREE